MIVHHYKLQNPDYIRAQVGLRRRKDTSWATKQETKSDAPQISSTPRPETTTYVPTSKESNIGNTKKKEEKWTILLV